jgi:hypothetical protein
MDSFTPFGECRPILVPIVEYNPDLFPDLQEMVARLPGRMNLAHRPFVDYYYASRSWSKLYLYLSESGRVVGTTGRELVRFEYGGREITMRNGSNWFSVQRGVGGELLKYSTQFNPNSSGFMLVASPDAVKVFHHYGWVSVSGVAGYFLNGCSLYPWDSWWKAAANSIVRQFAGKKPSSFISRIQSNGSAGITVCEEQSYSPDLLPRRSPFMLRFAPTIEYLEWRYNLSLSFVRYRLFRIQVGSASVGYVVLNEAPQQIIVAQCDGEDAIVLAYGILLALAQVGGNDKRPRTIFLSSCHSEMRQVFERFGFRAWLRADLPCAFHGLPADFDLAGTSKWLMNYDWSDNGLQGPFLDQAAGSQVLG